MIILGFNPDTRSVKSQSKFFKKIIILFNFIEGWGKKNSTIGIFFKNNLDFLCVVVGGGVREGVWGVGTEVGAKGKVKKKCCFRK